MSWFRRARRPAYAVDGVEPRHSDDWDFYDGDALAGQAPVADAVARLPQDPALEYLLYSLGIGTPDGREWTLTFGDESLIHFDLSIPGTDIFEENPHRGAVHRPHPASSGIQSTLNTRHRVLWIPEVGRGVRDVLG